MGSGRSPGVPHVVGSVIRNSAGGFALRSVSAKFEIRANQPHSPQHSRMMWDLVGRPVYSTLWDLSFEIQHAVAGS